MTENRSISIDKDLIKEIDNEAHIQRRSFSGMMCYMAKLYFEHLKQIEGNEDSSDSV